MKFFNLNLVSTIILITASSLLTQKSLANTFGSWPFANNTSQNNQVGISQYYYVGQGKVGIILSIMVKFQLIKIFILLLVMMISKFIRRISQQEQQIFHLKFQIVRVDFIV